MKKIDLKSNQFFEFIRANLENKVTINNIFERFNLSHVVHLAAQAGVRFSISNPESYIESNLVGFFNIIENCKKKKIKHFLYASSSSVYGGNTKIPFSE